MSVIIETAFIGLKIAFVAALLLAAVISIVRIATAMRLT